VSFRRRVVLLSAGAAALAIAIAAVSAYLIIAAQLRDQVDRNLEKDASRVSAIGLAISDSAGFLRKRGPDSEDRILVFGPDATARQSQRFLDQLFSGDQPGGRDGSAAAGRRGTRIVLPRGPLGTTELYAQIVSADGRIIRPPFDLELPSTAAVEEVASGKKEDFYYQTEVDGVQLRVFVTELGQSSALQVARPLTEVEDTLQRLLIVLGVVTLGGVGLAVILGLFVARLALTPVTRLTRDAESIALTGDLTHRMDLVGDRELDRLARSFNSMMDALERSRDMQQQLVADASHELRTPLTSIRTNIEVLIRGEDLAPAKKRDLTASVVAQIDEVTHLIGDLIDLARETETEKVTWERLRLDELVEGVIERIGHRPGGASINLEAEPCEIEGVPVSLDRAILNLVDNAIKWSPAGSAVEVAVSGGGLVTVRDHGPGVNSADVEHIFDRFYRSPEARGLPGSGLGLSIVRQIAENHGGTVTVSAAPGGGASFGLDLSARQVRGILI
jgi:two-component system sensor histidine kinase MprB